MFDNLDMKYEHSSWRVYVKAGFGSKYPVNGLLLYKNHLVVIFTKAHAVVSLQGSEIGQLQAPQGFQCLQKLLSLWDGALTGRVRVETDTQRFDSCRHCEFLRSKPWGKGCAP